MRFDTITWKNYQISDLFEVRAGKYYYIDEYSEGETPYVSASNENNGIPKYINITPDFEGNCIITGKVGCTAFYQEHDFCATSDVNILTPKHFNLNRELGLFITTIINKSENYKWSYGRQCRVNDTKCIKIKLPTLCNNKGELIIDEKMTFSEKGYIPDWGFMEDYIEKLKSKPITTKIPNAKIRLEYRKYKEFKIGDLFEKIYKSKSYSFQELEEKNKDDIDSIAYISRTDLNNGCRGYVFNDGTFQVENGNALTIGDTTATCFYQANKFITGDHMVVLRNESWLNLETGLFIKSLIQKEKYRYSYGRAFTMDKIRDTKILLPITIEGNPDWEYMENYIKSLPYSDRI